jgi:hypothetical protein
MTLLLLVRGTAVRMSVRPENATPDSSASAILPVVEPQSSEEASREPPVAQPPQVKLSSEVSDLGPGVGGPSAARLELVGDPNRIIEDARAYGFEVRFRGERPPDSWRGRVVFAEFTLYIPDRAAVLRRMARDLAGLDLADPSPHAVRFSGGRLVPITP